MINLRDLSTNKRHDVLWMALDFVLQDISVPTRTADVATIMRARLAFPAADMPIVLTWLKKVAPRVPEAAQTGEAVRVYGNIGRRWVWSPRARAPKLGTAELAGDQLELETPKRLDAGPPLEGETTEAYRARIIAAAVAAGQEPETPKLGTAELAGDQLELETSEAYRARITAAAVAAGQEDDW